MNQDNMASTNSEKYFFYTVLFGIILLNLFLTYFLCIARTILERLYSPTLPIITQMAFRFCYWPFLYNFLYFVTRNQWDSQQRKNYLIIILYTEMLIIIFYFFAYVYPLVFTSTAILHPAQ